MKKILLVIFLFFGCDVPLTSTYDMILDVRLQMVGDIYTLDIDHTNWQTLHRISGTVLENGHPAENIKVLWESSHYWIIGDTLSYIVQAGYNDDFIYVSVDTNYITWLDGYIVPTINGASYSNSDGEINTIIAPTQTMINDTLIIWYSFKTALDSIKIKLI